jgi:hypothetical protein
VEVAIAEAGMVASMLPWKSTTRVLIPKLGYQIAYIRYKIYQSIFFFDRLESSCQTFAGVLHDPEGGDVHNLKGFALRAFPFLFTQYLQAALDILGK